MKKVLLTLGKLKIQQEGTSQVGTRRTCFEHHPPPHSNMSKEKERHSPTREQSHHFHGPNMETKCNVENGSDPEGCSLQG